MIIFPPLFHHFGKAYPFLKDYELNISKRNLDTIENCEKIIILEIIAQFDRDLKDRNVKKRENDIYMTNGIFVFGIYNNIEYKIIACGGGQIFVGSVLGFPRGSKLQKDGTQNSSNEDFSSISFQKQLE